MVILNHQSKSVRFLCERDEKLAKVIDAVGSLQYTTERDPFVFLIDTVIGQMLSNRVAAVLSKRFWALSDGTIEGTAKLTADHIRGIGVSNAKVKTILAVINEFVRNPSFPDILYSMTDEEVENRLTQIPGIGPWSAKMFLIFVLDRQNILPFEDGAFIQAFEAVYGIKEKSRNKKLVRAACKIWDPYASVAARYLYRYLDMGLVARNKGKEH